jgi:pimeloyl-ACP methyl ester carboxylesterase
MTHHQKKVHLFIVFKKKCMQLSELPALGVLLAAMILASPVFAGLDCIEGTQDSNSVYRICKPPTGSFNGSLLIWAHGFQDANEPVAIPEDQLQLGDLYLPDLATQLGFRFATNSYSKTGLAIQQGMADILDLVYIDADKNGPPENVYLVGASEGGIITALLIEQHPDIFKGGYALCGPVGDFPYQINFFGDARVTFEYFFPRVVPGYGIFNNIDTPIEDWGAYFEDNVRPLIARKPSRWNQWVRVAKLPYDADDYVNTTALSADDVLRYSAINLLDAIDTLGGFPFENRWRWYSGSRNDFWLNLLVKRFRADPAAVDNMKDFYNTSGDLDTPLVTMHTLRDQQIPYFHEVLYNLKTIASGSFLFDHLNIPVDRYGHCEFTPEEALAGFALMLVYAGDLELLSGVGTVLQGESLKNFEAIAEQEGIPYQVEGEKLAIEMK